MFTLWILMTLQNKVSNVLHLLTAQVCLWHYTLEHASMEILRNLLYNEHVHGLPKLKFEKDHLFDVYQMDKQIKRTFKAKNMYTTSMCLQLSQMDLFGPTK